MVVSKAGQEDKPTTQYVYEYPDGTTAKLYINDDYVYPMSKEQPAFWINGEYWYPNPPTGTPAFRVSGKFVYEEGASDTPKYYLGWRELAALTGCAKLRQRSLPVSQEDAPTMPKEQTVTLDEVVEAIGGEVRKSVDKYFDFLQKTVSSYPLGDTELGGKARACAEKNITMARDYMHKLSRAKNFLEVVPIHTEFMQSQLGFMGEQIKSLGEIYTKAAEEMLHAPLQTEDAIRKLSSIISPSVR
jgi:hypothetical protein